MKDNYGRTIEYLRISVTDRCNLRCLHCMPPEGVLLMTHAEILSYEEIAAVAREAAKLGIRKVRLTGGEPLVRPQLHRLAEMLKDIPGIERLVLTTNGVLLKRQLPDLLAAGLDGVNFSLNALDREAYKDFTCRDEFDAAMEGLHAALDASGLSVKINCVPAKGREEQILKLASLARDTRASVRFIELMPIGRGSSLQGINQAELISLLQDVYGQLVEVVERPEGVAPNGPAAYVRFPGFQSDIGFISAVSCRFCETCNRIRLTADGRLKSCLAFPAGEDVKDILRSGGSAEELRACIARCIESKPKQHAFGSLETEEQRLMSQIGG
jgi:cyclic pyranopterin phosphate synthase